MDMPRLAATILWFLAASTSLGAAPAVEILEPNRVILLLVVNPTDDLAKKDVTTWLRAFRYNIDHLLGDFALGGSARNQGIRIVVNQEIVEDVNVDKLSNSFDRQPSLHVLSALGTNVGNSTLVESYIYLGSLKGSLTIPYVHISQDVRPDRYKVTRDALDAVTLYAYAMAVANALPDKNRFVVCRVLARANTYRNSELDTDARRQLDGLFAAISAELEARTCGGKR